MSTPSTDKKLIAIVGATAAGKSDAAILVAQRFGGEVINADSRLFYRGMEIGTASPPEKALSTVPHHLIGFLEPESQFNLAEFLTSARNTVTAIQTRSSLPVLAGGTGQYVWGLLEGWQVPTVPPDAQLRAELESDLAEHGVDALYARLKDLDPQIAATTDGKNHRRLIRALERIASGTGQSHRNAVDPGYNSLVIGLHVERAELHRRITARVDAMLMTGWVEEVERLITAGTDFSSSALSAIGYREISAALTGEITFAEARERTIRATNRLVRHQNNWFKLTDQRISWIDVTDGYLNRVIEPVQEWITK